MEPIILTKEQIREALRQNASKAGKKGGNARWYGMSKEDRTAHITKMIEARKAKKQAQENNSIDN